MPPSDRLDAIDALRGLALFGVMAINLVFEFRVSIFEQFFPESVAIPPLDRIVERFLTVAVDMKAFSLFSILFGLGLAIQFERLAGNSRRIVLLMRRLIVLLAIGLVHLILIWNGDILTEYALAGFVVLPFLFWPRWFLGVSVIVCLGFYLGMPPLVSLPDATWMQHDMQAARLAYGNGDFVDVLAFRVHELAGILPLHVSVFPRTIGLFLLGALIWRTGIVRRADMNRGLFLAVAVAGILIGLATTLVGVGMTRAIAPVVLALGDGAAVMAAMTTSAGRMLLGWAAPLGRMAFTNYVAQSVIFGGMFYGYGLGLFDRLGAAAALGFGIAIYAAQAVFSEWWLKRHRFGPLEWLWRTLMYGVRQPMQASSALTAAIVAERKS
jgi:uncharacterized protein